MKKIHKSNVSLAYNAFGVIVFTWLTFGFDVSRVEAQGVKVNNATLKSSGNFNFVVRDGNFINNGIYATDSETLIFTGTQAVVVSGTVSTTFANLTLSNEAGLTLENDVFINDMLEFVNGKITTGDHLMTMGPVGTISNTSSSSYIEGKLANTYSMPGTKSFPIGKDGNYRPVALQFSALTGTSIVTAEQFETGLTGTLPADVTLTTTNRLWSITQTGGSDMQYFVTLDATGYTPERPVVILKKDGGLITSHLATSPDYTNTTALTTFSQFGLGEECVNPIAGGTIAGDQTICANESPAMITGYMPGGFTGTLEYKWQVSISSSTEGFSDIADSDSEDYAPGTITQTSWFKRLARVDCKADWTGASESNVVEVYVEPLPVAGGLIRNPDEDFVCQGCVVSATLISGSGGNGIDVLEYRTNDGTLWSDWEDYTSGYEISTTGLTDVQIRSWREADYCDDSDMITVTWKTTLELSGLVVTDTQCFGSEGVIIANGLTVEPGGNVTLISGVSIQLKPGVLVLIGGRLHAYISNELCENLTPLLASEQESTPPAIETESINQNSHSFSLYPNPTTGVFTLEFINADNTDARLIEIYSIMGELLFSKKLACENTCRFDLVGKARGIYIIRVVQGNEMEIKKLIIN